MDSYKLDENPRRGGFSLNCFDNEILLYWYLIKQRPHFPNDARERKSITLFEDILFLNNFVSRKPRRAKQVSKYFASRERDEKLKIVESVKFQFFPNFRFFQISTILFRQGSRSFRFLLEQRDDTHRLRWPNLAARREWQMRLTQNVPYNIDCHGVEAYPGKTKP